MVISVAIATTIALVGPGAVGTTVAALLYKAGHQVLLCGHTPRDSIELRPDGGDPIVVPGPVLTDPGQVPGSVDVVVLAVKATQNDDAAGWLARLCDEHTIVTVLQNGVEQVEQVKPHCPSSPVIPGIVWYSAETQPQGWVRLRTEAALVLPSGPAATTVAELLRGAGCRVDTDPDFITAAWRKLLTNALAGFMVLSRRRSGMFRRDDVAELSRRYVAECLAVARAEGARLPDDVVDEIGRHVPSGTRRHGHLDPGRRGKQAADGMGHPQRGDHSQGPRARPADADQRRAGAAAGRGQRRSRLG